MRRFGDPVRQDVRYTRRAGVYAILTRADRVLLTHQRAPWPEFQLPGGGVDPGEQPLSALNREVLEETGWRIAGTRRLSVHRRFTFMPDYRLWAEKVCTIYLAHPALRLGEPSEEGHRAVWVPPDWPQAWWPARATARLWWRISADDAGALRRQNDPGHQRAAETGLGWP